jgi:hypothetical protein
MRKFSFIFIHICLIKVPVRLNYSWRSLDYSCLSQQCTKGVRREERAALNKLLVDSLFRLGVAPISHEDKPFRCFSARDDVRSASFLEEESARKVVQANKGNFFLINLREGKSFQRSDFCFLTQRFSADRNENLSDEIMIVLEVFSVAFFHLSRRVREAPRRKKKKRERAKDNKRENFFHYQNVFHSLARCLRKYAETKAGGAGRGGISAIKNYQHHIDDVLFEFNFVGVLLF